MSSEPDPLVVTIDDIRDARRTIEGVVHRTPVLTSASAARIAGAAAGVGLADGRLYAKAEHLQRTGSFKPRGATVRITHLSPEAAAAGVIAVSAGNHGQAVAWAARAAGVRATVVMPVGAVRSKVQACRAYGAEVVLVGERIGDTWAEMERIRDARGLTFLHPFDDADVIAGQGTVGLEILEDVPDVDVLVVPAGGGGLACGIAAAVKETRPGVRVHAVEPEESAALTAALAADEIVHVQPRSIADGLGAPFAGPRTLAMGRRYLDGIALVDDASIAGAMRFAAERMKQVLEPAGAAGLAALLRGLVPLRDGDRVCVVLSGGNVDLDRLATLVGAGARFADPAGPPDPADPEIAGS
jgi:threonine dehydratase